MTPHNFIVFELWPTNFGRLVVLLEGFPTVLKCVDQSSPVSRKWGPNFKFLPPISASPRGFRRQFCHRTIGGLSSCLNSKIERASPIPQFLGNFFPNFSVPIDFGPRPPIWRHLAASSSSTSNSFPVFNRLRLFKHNCGVSVLYLFSIKFGKRLKTGKNFNLAPSHSLACSKESDSHAACGFPIL